MRFESEIKNFVMLMGSSQVYLDEIFATGLLRKPSVHGYGKSE